MIRRLNLFGFYLRLCCATLPAIAFVAAWWLRFHIGWLRQPVLDPPMEAQLIMLLTVIWGIVSQHYGVSNPEDLLISTSGIRSAFSACCVTYAIVLAISFFYPGGITSRFVFPASAVLLLVMAVATREGFRLLLRRVSKRRSARLLIIGSDRTAHVAARLINNAYGGTVIGFVQLPGQAVAAHAPVYRMEDVPSLKNRGEVDDVVIALPPELVSKIPALVNTMELLAMPVRVVLGLGKGAVIREKLIQVGDLDILDLASSPNDRLDYILAKRAFDIVFSLAAILATAPLMLAIAVLIRLSSPGPVLFVQDRVGLHGRIFPMYKFRSMHVSSASESDTQWTTVNDPRRTWIGALLRKSSLDELPQFFNVLKGDMSVVGPRPERPHFASRFVQQFEGYDSRHRLQVGITGWAQVNGLRGDTSIAKRLEYDLYYMQNWSLWFDIRIVLSTIWSGLLAKTAY